MILQSLHDYYLRAEGLPREGWVRRGVDYAIVLDEQGQCIAIEALGEKIKGKMAPREMQLPSIGKQSMKHTNSGKDANLLWDNASFVFGGGNKGSLKLSSFIQTLSEWLGSVDDPALSSVFRFANSLLSAPETLPPLLDRFGLREDFETRDPVLVFRLVSDVESVHQRPAIRAAFENTLASKQASEELRGNCLITGERNAPLVPNESVIKGVWGGQPAGCNIVAFNARAFESYGKRERNGENAPISLQASFAYTTALNHLLASKQRIQVGDASTVFWADREHDLEAALADIFGDDPDANTRAVHALYDAVHSGKLAPVSDENRFHVLGLAPNEARISVRFYQCLPLSALATRIVQHFEDLKLVRGKNDPEYPSLKRLLQSVCLVTATQPYGDIKKLPPNLSGAVLAAIFAGPNVPYPSLWLNVAVNRCRAEQAINYLRAAIIKACLNRQIRRSLSSEKEFQPMLDHENRNPAYRLGRLFAVLERLQEESAGGVGKLNATIRDRYYGAASSSPATVFPVLLKLKNHHVSKLDERARRVLYRAFEDHRPDDYIGEIVQHIAEMPAHLPLQDQGRFALGYYHQRQAFFTKHDDQSTSEGI